MKKRIAFVLGICIFLCFLTGCGKPKEPDSMEKTVIMAYLTITPISAEFSGSYALSTEPPKKEIGDIEFITWKRDGSPNTVYYTPTKELEFSDFGAILSVMTVQYGTPTYSDSSNTYQWLSEDGNFDLRITYTDRILNNSAMCVSVERN